MPYIQTRTGGELNRHVLELYKHAGSSNPTPKPPPIESRAAHVIPGNRDEMFFDHKLETSAIVPAFTPSWNATVYPISLENNRFKTRFSGTAPQKNGAVDFVVSRGTRQAVLAGATTATITHNFGDASIVVLVSAGWNTNIWYTAKTANALILAFNVPAPSNDFIYWSRHQDDDDLSGTDAIAVDAETATIVHNAGQPGLPIFLLPSWNTAIRYVNKTEPNQTVVSFSTPPLVGNMASNGVLELVSGGELELAGGGSLELSELINFAALDWKVKYLR